MYGKQKKSPFPRVSHFYSPKIKKLWSHEVNSMRDFHDWQTEFSCKSNCRWFRTREVLEFGRKERERWEYSVLLFTCIGMDCSGRNLAGNNAAAVVCSRETMMAVICFVGKLLEPALGIHGGHACWIRSDTAGRVRWQGSSHGEHDKAGRRRRQEKKADGKR